MLDTKELRHLRRIIEREVSYFNGWAVSEKAVEDSCHKAAVKIDRYLAKKLKRPGA